MVLQPEPGAPYAAGISPEHAQMNEGLKADALRAILRTALVTGGIGGGFGLLSHMLSKDTVPSSEADEADIAMPYPQVVPGKRKKVSNALLSSAMRKQAVLHVAAAATAPDWADTVVKNVIPTPVGQEMPSLWSPRWLRGDSQTSSGTIPWVAPAGAAATVGGLMGGHQLVKWLLRKRRQSNLDAEVDQAKKEYEDAMLGQYNSGSLHHVPKRASISELYETSKQAGFNELLGGLTGTYLMGAGALAGASGLATYKYLKSRSKRKLLENAVERRARERAEISPADVFIHPTPVRMRGDQLQSTDRADIDPLKTLSS